MPDGEEILAICLGEGWAAVATDRRMVRMFSIGGLQKEVFSLPGPVVAMAGHTNQLLVTYHRGMGEYFIRIDVISKTIIDYQNYNYQIKLTEL